MICTRHDTAVRPGAVLTIGLMVGAGGCLAAPAASADLPSPGLGQSVPEPTPPPQPIIRPGDTASIDLWGMGMQGSSEVEGSVLGGPVSAPMGAWTDLGSTVAGGLVWARWTDTSSSVVSSISLEFETDNPAGLFPTGTQVGSTGVAAVQGGWSFGTPDAVDFGQGADTVDLLSAYLMLSVDGGQSFIQTVPIQDLIVADPWDGTDAGAAVIPVGIGIDYVRVIYNFEAPVPVVPAPGVAGMLVLGGLASRRRR